MNSNLRMLLHYLIKVRWSFLLILVFVTMEVLAKTGLTGVQKFIVDDTFMNQKYNLIWIFALIYLGMVGVNQFFFIYENQYIRKVRNKVGSNIFRDMLHRIQRMPVSRLQQERTAKLVENLTHDIYETTWYALDIPHQIQNVLHAILLSVLLSMISPVFLFISLTAAVLFLVIGKWMAPKFEAAGRDVSKTRTDWMVATEEAISSTREVIAFDRKEWEKNRFIRLGAKFLHALKRHSREDVRYANASQPIFWGIQLVVIAYGGYLVMEDSISIGTFVVVFHFCTDAIWAYFYTISQVLDFSKNVANFDRIRSILDAETVEEGTLPLEDTVREINVRKLSFTYPSRDKPVLHNFNMNIPLGKTIAIVGASGGGKSTIAQLLVRTYLPDAGQISVNGMPLHNISRRDWGSKVSVVFQDPFLFPESIRTNLMLGSEYPQETMIEVCKMMQIHEMIESFPQGYETEVGERGIQLSGGQRQRIVLARALLRNTEILILDEATSALDYVTERQIYQSLRKLREGKTTVIIAHRLSTIKDADSIYVIDGGQVVEEGTHHHLLAEGGLYAQLVAAGDKLNAFTEGYANP